MYGGHGYKYQDPEGVEGGLAGLWWVKVGEGGWVGGALWFTG